MTDIERILYYQSLERGIAEAELEMERLKDLHAKAKKVYESRIEELRSAIRRNEDEQQELPFTPHQVIGEDRQIPENKTSEEEFAEDDPPNVLTLPERPVDEDHDNGR